MPDRRRAGLVGLVVVLVACAPGGAATATPSSTSVSGGGPAANLAIYGAASLESALDQAKTAYESGHPGTTLTISTDSSAALETQIEQGAPADVFLSADTTNPKKLVDRGLALGAAMVFAANELTIIVPSANSAGIASPADLARTRIKVVAAGDQVPITTYAKQLIANLGMQPGYPADFATKVAANVVSKEDNVKAVVAKIELGEGDAGIVYVTDAKASAKVATVDVPETAKVRATYAGVVVGASRNAAAAKTFLDWVAGPDGQAILAGFGFLPAS
ncbi:MAG TPA: molybdate ABC transporter substrate-binding protein [Candidatus Limnocylindrales bacterium]|nr:molybdate ABC transporter substrate-binding protein [Candidatus Limnocylindrales bacterium]